MRYRKFLVSMAILVPAACDSEAPEPVVYEKLSVRFDGRRSHENPVTPYTDLVDRLKRQAADEARDGRAAPVVSTQYLGLRGEKMLVAAITPRRGVFYYTDYGPYPLEGQPIVRRGGEIEVCRFAVAWDTLPGGAYVPGLVWADPALLFPGFDCNRRTDPKIATVVAQWHRASGGASYSVVASGSEAGLKAAVVLEAWPGRPGSAPSQPFDGGRAVLALAGKGDRTVKAIPLSADQEFYVETAGGRSFVGIEPGSLSYQVSSARCIVEGLRWSDLASSDARRRPAAMSLCNRLMDEYAKSDRPEGDPPPHVISTLPTSR